MGLFNLLKTHRDNYRLLKNEAARVAGEIGALPYQELVEKFGRQGVFELTRSVGDRTLHFGIKLVLEEKGVLHIEVDASGLPTGLFGGAVGYCFKKPEL